MSDLTNPSKALDLVHRIEMVCNFTEGEPMRKAIADGVPISMPQDIGSLGFDVPLWCGLGIVGLRSALDAFAKRGGIPPSKCNVCNGTSCIKSRFAQYTEPDESTAFGEVEDLRRLFAHN